MTTIGLSTLAKAVLLPPNLLFILMILRALVSPRYARFGRALAITAFALLVVLVEAALRPRLHHGPNDQARLLRASWV